MPKIVRYFLSGFSMGTADLVPGVSGGTIALILGIYEKLITSIKLVTSDALKLGLKLKLRPALQVIPWSFLVPLGLGLITAIILLSSVIERLLSNYPIQIWSFFFGLVLASSVIIGKKIGSWQPSTIALMLGATLFGYFLVGLVPLQTAATPLAFFLSGMIAIVAMILPGVSGSFLLIILGKYQQVLAAVSSRNLPVLIVFMVGAVVGLALFSKVLTFLFKKYHDATMAVLLGFMVGSLRKIWPWKEITAMVVDGHGQEIPVGFANVLPNQSLGMAIFLMIAAIVLVLLLNHFGDDDPGKRIGS